MQACITEALVDNPYLSKQSLDFSGYGIPDESGTALVVIRPHCYEGIAVSQRDWNVARELDSVNHRRQVCHPMQSHESRP